MSGAANAADMPVPTGIIPAVIPTTASPGHLAARRLRSRDIAWLADRLSDRDWQIVEVVNRLRIVSGKQLELLCFPTLHAHAAEVVRGRALHRLTDWRVLTQLPRRIGGATRGSASAIYALGPAGARLWTDRQQTTSQRPRTRSTEVPTDRTLRHTLAVSELDAQLVAQASRYGAQIRRFEAEPASWWPNGLGGYLKPDAYTLLATEAVREHWWIEVDQATESLPTITRKLSAYLDFVARGQLGPQGLVPRVLVSAITPARGDAIVHIVQGLPDPAGMLFLVVTQPQAAACMLGSLRNDPMAADSARQSPLPV